MFVNRRTPTIPLKISFILIGLALCLGAIAPAARGSAFSIAELGARAAGMGTAFTSIADDGSALFFNPAGLAFQPGTRFEMDNLVVVGLFHFFPLSPPPPHFVPQKSFSSAAIK